MRNEPDPFRLLTEEVARLRRDLNRQTIRFLDEKGIGDETIKAILNDYIVNQFRIDYHAPASDGAEGGPARPHGEDILNILFGLRPDKLPMERVDAHSVQGLVNRIADLASAVKKPSSDETSDFHALLKTKLEPGEFVDCYTIAEDHRRPHQAGTPASTSSRSTTRPSAIARRHS